MTLFEQLEQYAYDHDIRIIHVPVEGAPAIAAQYHGLPVIFFDDQRLQTEPERVQALAHEIVHVERGTLRSPYIRFTPPGKLERQTEARTIEKLISRSSLEAAIAACGGRMWEVAEELGFSESFIRKAIRHYQMREGV